MLRDALLLTWKVLLRQGLKETLLLIYSRVVDKGFDLKYGTETYAWIAPEHFGVARSQADAAEPYRPSHAGALRSILSMIDKSDRKVFLDIGCGKGRALIVAAEAGFTAIRGLEFSAKLVSIARRNLETFSQKTSIRPAFELIHDDAACYRFRDDETCFYLFNPSAPRQRNASQAKSEIL
jgi:SAM-dependent methyltransferase